MYIDVYEGDDKIVTFGATLLSDIELRETYRAIDSAATGRIPSLFCAEVIIFKQSYFLSFSWWAGLKTSKRF